MKAPLTGHDRTWKIRVAASDRAKHNALSSRGNPLSDGYPDFFVFGHLGPVGTLVGMAGLSKDDIRFSLEIAREHGFSEVHLSDGDGEFTAELKPIPVAKVSAPAVAASATSVLQVKSAFVGYFRSANPELMLGDAVKPGQVVGSVETLGLLNDVESKVAGHITEIKVTDGDAVDFGKVLFTVEP